MEKVTVLFGEIHWQHDKYVEVEKLQAMLELPKDQAVAIADGITESAAYDSYVIPSMEERAVVIGELPKEEEHTVVPMGYYAKDYRGHLYKFEWGTGEFEGKFYIVTLEGRTTANPEDYEILELGHFSSK